MTIQLEVMLKEYDALRQEILASMNTRVSILSFGIATIGAILTAIVATYKEQPFSLFIPLMLTLLIPSICILVLFIWLGEHERINRAGKFLVILEDNINKEVTKIILTWETSLRKNKSHMQYPYFAVALLFIIISLVSQLIGIFLIEIVGKIMMILIMIGTITHFSLLLYICNRLSKGRTI